MERGFVANIEVEMAHRSLFKRPIAFYLHGTKITIQLSLAKQINVELA